MSKLLLVAVGANLPDAARRLPLATCEWAVERIAALPGLALEAVSRWYRSAPIPASDQPDFVNGVIRLHGDPDPAALLLALHEIEAQAGRTRPAPNAARVLDLDLLAVGDRVVVGPALMLPHPRLAERGFVLYPLCDVAPEWRHPVLGRTARQLCAALPPQRVEPLPSQRQTPI